jgi:hypothetical protein
MHDMRIRFCSGRPGSDPHRAALRRGVVALGGLALLACQASACNAVLNLDRFEREPDAGRTLEAATPAAAPDADAPSDDTRTEPDVVVPMSTLPEPGESRDAGAAPDAAVSMPTPSEPDEPRSDAGLEPDAAVSTPSARVGSPCASDVDCTTAAPPTLSCFASSLTDFPGIIARGGEERLRGGPAGGHCSRACLADGECGGGARCLAHEGGARLCFATCSLDASTPQCDGAAPQACVPVDDPPGAACYPLCARDADCDEGRQCDAASGLCRDGLVRGSGGIGAACTVASEATDCSSGLCWNPEDTGIGVCTALCRTGGGGCGTGDDAAASATACMSDFIGLGAVGSCMRLCDVDEDCDGGYGCLLGSPVAGREGYCVPPAFLGSQLIQPRRSTPG